LESAHGPTSRAAHRREVHFADDEIIVSKTNLKGIITYANDVFLRVAGYTEDEILGEPHNVIRHPDVPRCVFKLLWDTLKSGNEIFAYVLNQARNGDHYWVFAHVTPSFDLDGKPTGYHSNRRVPHADALAAVKALYAQLRQEEQRHAEPAKALDAGMQMVLGLLDKNSITYDEFVFSLSKHTQLASV
jgi:PAS domain S-box-containing protein